MRKMRKESLYAPLLALGLVVTKESIKPAHNLAGEVCQKKLREKTEGKHLAQGNLHPENSVSVKTVDKVRSRQQSPTTDSKNVTLTHTVTDKTEV